MGIKYGTANDLPALKPFKKRGTGGSEKNQGFLI